MAVPERCPECGRFLSRAFVEELASSDAACPRCGATLTPGMFRDSVRPPDLDPAAVRVPPDPLEGWDETPRDGGDPGEVLTVPYEVVAVAVGVGAAAGFVSWRRRPVLGALIGAATVAGTTVAGSALLRGRGP